MGKHGRPRWYARVPGSPSSRLLAWPPHLKPPHLHMIPRRAYAKISPRVWLGVAVRENLLAVAPILNLRSIRHQLHLVPHVCRQQMIRAIMLRQQRPVRGIPDVTPKPRRRVGIAPLAYV